MTAPRKTKQLGKQADRKLSGAKRKVGTKLAGVKVRRIAPTSAKQALHGAKSLTGKPRGVKRNHSKVREAGQAVGTFLGRAIGKTERILKKTAETAKGILG